MQLNFEHILYGGDYNPEQWSREVWQEDAKLMQQAGINFVSLGIFSWAFLEPRAGNYDFAWLDEIMDLLHEHGVGVNLATAVASPPPWLSLKYPDSKPVTVDGVRLEVGGRQLYCPSHEAFRDHAAQLIDKLAARYKTHPALRMWHINNEYGCHIDQCFCENCAKRFRVWLQERYDNIQALNLAWGTAFWSQRYSEWDEIQPPRRAPTYANPAQQLDWRRFSSDNLLSLYQMEVKIIRNATPEIPVTTNFLGFLKGLDYFKWAQEEDLVSVDTYPDPSATHAHLEAGMTYDMMRSLRHGQRWILMEQATSAVNWRQRNAPKRPGMMRALNHQALAHGANGLMFFQWRASRAGAEKYHSGMVQHVGTERSRVWREVQALGQELQHFKTFTRARIRARVAIMFDWHNWWALEIDSKPSDLKLMPLVQKWYAALRQLGQSIDFVHPDGNLGNYDVVVVPNQYMISSHTAQNIRNYVENGGVLVAGFFSGIVNELEQVQLGGYPALLQDVFGIWVEEWLALQSNETNSVRIDADNKNFAVQDWAEVIHLKGASVIAHFEQDYIADQPAVTMHDYGNGSAYYIGCDLLETGVQHVLLNALTRAKVPFAQVPVHLNVVLMDLGEATVLHVVNFHATQEVRLELPANGVRFEDGTSMPSLCVLPAYGVVTVRFHRHVNIDELVVKDQSGILGDVISV